MVDKEVLAQLRRAHRASHADPHALLRKVVTVCTEMLTDRGCAEVDVRTERPVDRASAAVVGGPSPSTGVFFLGTDRVAVRDLRAIVDETTTPYDIIVLLSGDGPTAFARKEAAALSTVRVQFFRYRDLCVNITRHHLVPKHTRCAETSSLPPRSALPKLLRSDPVAQYYDFQVGEVIAIARILGDDDDGARPYYRVVVPEE